jgi:glycerol-3-phosphate acyltransferase PlsY
MSDAFVPITAAHLIAAIAGYLAGSIPFGLILSRVAGIGDIRTIGSGNVGATNVLRSGRKGIAALTLLLDTAKGAAAVLVAAMWGPGPALLAGLFSVVGHDFPVWLKFRGGKGVATSLGVLLALAWPVALTALAVWIVVAAVFRYSSLAALAALAAAPFLAWWLSTPSITAITAILAVLGIARHHTNLKRLLSGAESKIGGNRNVAQSS